tara:strand:+ start:1177 stop:1383 length:207 start_codon:yes stop_codon:yes gene_type:complete
MKEEKKLKRTNLGGYHLINCNKCNIKCFPIYDNSPYGSPKSYFVCRDCALKIMEGYYDKRTSETKDSD